MDMQIAKGEKLVRALFGVTCCRQPAVIFVDEIDSLLSQGNMPYIFKFICYSIEKSLHCNLREILNSYP